MKAERTGFLPALGEVVGGVYPAEYCVRRARDFGLMDAGPHGINRRWTVDDLAAIALTILVHETSRASRSKAKRRLRQDADWRHAVLAGIRRALCFGGEIRLVLDEPRAPMAVAVTMRPAAVVRLAALVDDWGDLRDARGAA